MDVSELDRWYRDNEAVDLLHSHDLTSDSLIVDIGSYVGKWIHKMNNMYGCKCIGVEPIEHFVKKSLENNFKRHGDCKIYNFALSVEDNGFSYISVNNDASSIFKDFIDKEMLKIKTKNAKDFFTSIKKRINVLQINAEGLEYLLIPYMVHNKLLDNVDFLQVQFHEFSELDKKKARSCIKLIEENGFETKFDYNFVWYGAMKIQ